MIIDGATVTTAGGGDNLQTKGRFSSLVDNGYYDYTNSNNERQGYVEGTNQANPSLLIKGGTFSGGLNTIKNDDNATLTIEGGDFNNFYQATVQNHNVATIKGGVFTAAAAAEEETYGVYNHGCVSGTDLGTLTITGGEFSGATFGVLDCSTQAPEVKIEDGKFNGTKAAIIVAKVVDAKGNATNSNAKVTITGGEFSGGEAAVMKSSESNEAVINITGGAYSDSVADYVDESLKAELISSSDTKTPYSYYSSVEAAKEAADPDDVVIDLTNTDSAQIVAVGFKADSSEANNAATALGKLMGAPDTWEGVSDCDPNTMYIGVRGTGTAASYKVVVTLGDTKVYEESVTEVTNGSIVYFTFEPNGGSHSETAIQSGTYTVSLYSTDSTNDNDEEAEAIDSKTIALSKVSFSLNGDLDTTPADTYYAAGSTVELPTPTRSGYRFNGWSDGSETYTGTYTVPADGKDITLTDSWTRTGGGSSHSSSSKNYTVTVDSTKNGDVTVSPKSAATGTTVTITVEPDEGYELDDLTVTDANGKTVKVTEGKNGKYTFTMPASKVTVEAAFAKISENVPDDSTNFTDVKASAWYAEAVQYVADKGMMQGTDSKTFSPNDKTTRGQIVTVLYRLEQEPAAGTVAFTDVAAGQYYAKAVAWAADKDIVKGYTETTFAPNDNITREQIAAILFRYAEYKGIATNTDGNLTTFTDAAKVSDWAEDAMKWSVGCGLLQGDNGALNPQGNATRAEIATMLMRFCENVAK